VGTLVPEIKVGRTYLRLTTGTSEGPRKNAFSTPQVGRASSAVFRAKFPRFRCKQQPKLRELFCKNQLIVIFKSLNAGEFIHNYPSATSEFAPARRDMGRSHLTILGKHLTITGNFSRSIKNRWDLRAWAGQALL
jgi:hypothetical protein